jgi:oligopeptide transport system substrate-binding protein
MDDHRFDRLVRNFGAKEGAWARRAAVRPASLLVWLGSLIAAVALAMSLLGTAVAAAQETGSNVLRIHQVLYPETADPQKSSFSSEISFLVSNYEGLTRLDQEGKTSPAAAESWEFNEDGTVLTFRLREGLTYSDGSPLTAENFRYAVERACDPNTAGDYQYVLFDIVGCEEFAGSNPGAAATPVGDGETSGNDAAREALGVTAIDERTLEVRLKHPAPYFPSVAGLWVFFPVKQELVEQGGEGWWQDPALQIGNGPFQVTRMERDQLIVLGANERYWGGRPALDAIELVYIADPAIALEAYRAGDLDIVQPDPAQYPTIQADPVLGQEFLSYPGTNTLMLTLDMKRAPFDDKKVREAFAYAFDRETWCDVVNNGDCVPTLTWIPAGVPGAIESDLYAFDPERAKQALAESSFGGPENLPPIEYAYIADIPEERTRGEWIAGQYRDILGVEITLVPMEQQAWVASISDPAAFPQTTLLGWFQDYPDPQNWLSLLWSCEGLYVPTGYCNPEFDRLVEQGDQELDEAKRLPLYEEASQVLLDDLPGVFLSNQANVYLVKPYVTGYVTSPSDSEWPGEWASPLTLSVER